MSNKQLPPELVEKYREAFSMSTKANIEKATQISVDYADEQNAYIVHTFTESLNELQKQRDELVELLKKVSDQFNAMPEGYDPGNCNGEILYTLKKHES